MRYQKKRIKYNYDRQPFKEGSWRWEQEEEKKLFVESPKYVAACLFVHTFNHQRGKKFGIAVNKWNEWLGKKFIQYVAVMKKNYFNAFIMNHRKYLSLSLLCWIWERKKLIKIFVAFVKHNIQPSHHRFLWQKFLSWIFKGNFFYSKDYENPEKEWKTKFPSCDIEKWFMTITLIALNGKLWDFCFHLLSLKWKIHIMLFIAVDEET